MQDFFMSPTFFNSVEPNTYGRAPLLSDISKYFATIAAAQ